MNPVSPRFNMNENSTGKILVSACLAGFPCGRGGLVYNGTFNGGLRAEDGVAATLLEQEGIYFMKEEEI